MRLLKTSLHLFKILRPKYPPSLLPNKVSKQIFCRYPQSATELPPNLPVKLQRRVIPPVHAGTEPSLTRLRTSHCCQLAEIYAA
jgi:hypothetical protein